MDRSVETHNFRAFISYSRSDRQWAKGLQARLERYVLPQTLRLVKPGLRHERRPLKPIFRDEDELVPGQDLPERIRQGLERSEYLIVVCSPHAVASEWVGKEIRDFIALGRADNILAVVVEGTPNAEAQGLAPELECLPHELRFEPELRKDETGRTTVNISSRPAEPLWVDWRKTGNRNRPMFLRLVAALLSLSSLDELVRKDRAYRRRRAALMWSVTGVAACCILGLGIDLLVQAHRSAIRESEMLVGNAQAAAERQDWEGSARFALLAMKRGNLTLIGFRYKFAEELLQGLLLSNPRIGTPYSVGSGSDLKTALARNGTALTVAAKDGTVQVLDPATGKPLRAPLRVGSIDGMGISPDGRLLATQKSTSIGIWDLSSGRNIATLKGRESLPSEIEFSPDNKSLVQYHSVFGAHLIDLASAEATDLCGNTSLFHGTMPNVGGISFSPDSKLVACGEAQGATVWSTTTGKPMTPWMKISNLSNVSAITLYSDDRMLVAGTSNPTADDGELIFWDMQGQRDLGRFNAGSIASIAFSRDGQRMGVQHGNPANSVGVWVLGSPPWDYANAEIQMEHGGAWFLHSGAFAFLPDGKRMVTVDSGTVRLWKLEMLVRRQIQLGDMGKAILLSFSPDGRVLEVLTDRGQAVPLDSQTLAPVGPSVSLPNTSDIGALEKMAFSPDSNLVAVSAVQATWIVNWRSGEHWQLPEQLEDVRALALSPDGKILAVSVSSLARHAESGEAIVGRVATDGAPHDQDEVQLWNVISRRPAGSAIELGGAVNSLAFSPDGTSLALVRFHDLVQVWDLNSRKRVSSFMAGLDVHVYFPNRQTLLTVVSLPDHNDRLRVWDAVTGHPLGPEMNPEIGFIRQVLFLDDGSRVLLVGESKLAFWDLYGNAQIGAPIPVPARILEAAHLSTDERQLFVASSDGDLFSWDIGDALRLRGQALIDEVCRTVLPGSLSKLTKEELVASPVLDPRRDADACGR